MPKIYAQRQIQIKFDLKSINLHKTAWKNGNFLIRVLMMIFTDLDAVQMIIYIIEEFLIGCEPTRLFLYFLKISLFSCGGVLFKSFKQYNCFENHVFFYLLV